jgi:hypothetical protein
MNEKETLGIVAENVDTLKRVRLVLSGITIEAKSAHDVASIDAALNNVIGSLSQILQSSQQYTNSAISE